MLSHFQVVFQTDAMKVGGLLVNEALRRENKTKKLRYMTVIIISLS